MLPTTNREKARMTISISIETQNKLRQLSHFQGKRISDFIRETIEEKLSQMDRQNLEDQIKVAYQELAHENILISNEFQYADSENL
jgi:predicted DNA-binding protein